MARGSPSRISAESPRTVVGVDVGGPRKGFHAVALCGGRYGGRYASSNAADVAVWCREMNASVVAVDAPCGWSTDGRARPAERQLMEGGIWCFSTPTRERAKEHPKDHFGWVLRGEALFQELRSTHPIRLPARGEKYCFETFPHAIAWHLTGGKANASRKRLERRALLAAAKVDLAELTNIDLVDAALCALAAHQVERGGAWRTYGEPGTGLIVVPTA